jgi:hypothetical protein
MGVHISKLCRRGLGAITLGLALALPIPAFAVDTVTVTVDQAKIVEIPPGTRTLIIGNPMIADVTLLKSGSTMIVTGKGFGETNMIALDSNGSPLAESNILVVGDPRGLVVQRGMERESYTCAPRCQPTAVLGDDSAFFNNTASQIQAHNSNALGK